MSSREVGGWAAKETARRKAGQGMDGAAELSQKSCQTDNGEKVCEHVRVRKVSLLTLERRDISLGGLNASSERYFEVFFSGLEIESLAVYVLAISLRCCVADSAGKPGE